MTTTAKIWQVHYYFELSASLVCSSQHKSSSFQQSMKVLEKKMIQSQKLQFCSSSQLAARRRRLLRVQGLLPGQRPGGLQARVESYALRRHRRSTAASRRRARGARSELPPPTRPWRARRPPWQRRAPTAEAAEISTFWLIKLGNQLGRGDSQKLF